MILRRRDMLTGAALLAGSTLIPRAAVAAGGSDRRLVVVMLRGGMDGLGAILPVGDPAFAALRPDQDRTGALPLDSFFHANAALPTLAAMVRSNEGLIFHATASPYRGRSHFDAQEVMESGLPRAGGADSGWLNRALAAIPMLAHDKADAVAVAATTPLLLRGTAPVESWQPQVLPYADPDLGERLLALYAARDPGLAQALQNGIGVDAFLGAAGEANERKAPAYSPAGFPSAVAALAALMARPNGPRVAMLNYDGWDTHAGEGARLTNQLGALDQGLANLRKGLGPIWQNCAVLLVTEFGRTARFNGSKGTDHGTAGVAFLVGGAVNGGRVVADWPGVGNANLHEARDLRPTTDIRAVVKGILQDSFGMSRKTLDSNIFPDSGAIAPMGGLIHT